jgi:inorganic pyrophosphatase
MTLAMFWTVDVPRRLDQFRQHVPYRCGDLADAGKMLFFPSNLPFRGRQAAQQLQNSVVKASITKVVMMNLPAGSIERLKAFDPQSGLVSVVIDTPAGSRCKYKYGEKVKLFRLRKLLPLGTSFPFNFGFVPSTRGEDDDPLDVLVLEKESFFAGCVVPVRLIGVLRATQTEQDGKEVRNDRLVGVIETPYNPPELLSLAEVGSQQTGRNRALFYLIQRDGRHAFGPKAGMDQNRPSRSSGGSQA